MRPVCFIAFALLAVTLTVAPAWAFNTPQPNAVLPTQHQQDQRASDDQASPYAMNYTDEVAQRLGVKDGKWEAFDTRSSDPISLRGGMDSGRPMISLQWRPGQ